MMTITEQHWRVLRAAISVPDQLTGLMQIMTDNRATATDVLHALRNISGRAEFIAQFCRDAEKLLPSIPPPLRNPDG